MAMQFQTSRHDVIIQSRMKESDLVLFGKRKCVDINFAYLSNLYNVERFKLGEFHFARFDLLC